MQFIDIIPVILDGEDYHAGILSYYPGDPGRLSGPPEHCYPPEPEEVEWELCDEEGNILVVLPLTEKQYQDIESQILDFIHNAQNEDFDEPDNELWGDIPF
jgi:hypothetical protein